MGGFDAATEIEKQIVQIPVRSQESWEDLALVGVMVDISDEKKATSIEVIRVPVEHERI